MERERRKIKILYAEDNVETLEIYRDNLIALGYDVCCVEDGVMALEMYKRERFDLLLLDVDLPHKRGDEVLKWVRQQGDRIPIVMFSETNKYVLIGRKEEYRADEYICKGCLLSEFQIRLENALEKVWGDDLVDRLTDRVSFDRRTFVLTVDNEQNFLGDRLGTICSIFCSTKNRGISLEELCMQIWNYRIEEDDPKIDEMRTYISKIRKLVEQDPRIKLYKIRGGDYVLSVASSEK